MPHYDRDWYKSVLDAMHDLVLVKGSKSNLLWANTAFLDYYGMTQEELLDIIDADHSDPDTTLQYVIDDQRVVDTGQAFDIPQEPITDAKGDVRMFHTIKSPVLEDDEVARIVCVARLLEDTEIRRRNIDHADAKAFVAPLQVLTRSFPNPMMMVDVKARVIHTSPLWNAAFGAVEITPNSYVRDFYDGLDALTEGIENCLRTKQSSKITVTFPQDDPNARNYALQISPWVLADGVMGGATVIATDVTELHERTSELQSANDELTQYAYRASHDLKGPISTVKGLAEFIVEDIDSGDTAEAAENARMIMRMMDQLNSNVKSILDLARADLEDGQEQEVDLQALLDEICAGLSALSDTSGVAIENRLDVRHLRSNPVRLRQIMENLIANSIRYHAPERTDKFVRVHSSRTDAGIAIEVEDNGRGIPEEAGDRIFDRFTRFHQNSEGSGLGLAIVKRNVEALSGQINVTSTDAGTAFRIVVPNLQFFE